MAAPLQHRPAAQQPRLPTTGSGSGDTAIAGLRLRFAPPPTGNGGGDDNALTNNPDHPMGAAQWAATPLGPQDTWPQSLLTTVDVMIGSGYAMCLAWGPDRTFLYNDAYAAFLGIRHPSALGLTMQEVWPDVWPDIAPLVERTFAGETLRFVDMPLVMTRHGYPEETWWDFSYSPVHDERGRVAGLLNVTNETTGRVMAERNRDKAVAELRESQSFMASVLAASTDCIKVLELDGTL